MINENLRIPAPARWINLTVAVLIAAAWGLLILWQSSHYAELLGHETLAHHHISFGVKLFAFLMSWFLMTVAMMLPASMPALIHSAHSTGQFGRNFRFLEWIILGYLSPWVLFGLLAFLGDNVLHELTETGGPLAGFSQWIAPSIALAAGIYQFTPVKQRFNQLCQTSHIIESRISMKNLANALGAGVRLGLFCVGSCWALMLMMFALGHHQLGWMFVMAVIFAGERLAPWGQKITWLVGSILLAWGVFWLLGGVL